MASRKSASSVKQPSQSSKSGNAPAASTIRGSDSTASTIRGSDSTASTIRGSDSTASTIRGSDSMYSTLGGSDAFFEYHCEPCSTEDINLEAAGYCQQCREYLCDNCYKCHQKSAASKYHKLLDKQAMPKVGIKPKVDDDLTDKCLTHADEVLEYFCYVHDKLCCGTCLSEDHGSCKDTTFVPDVSRGTGSSQEYKDTVIELNRLEDVVATEKKNIKTLQTEQKDYRIKANANVKSFKQNLRKKMEFYLTQMEREMVRKITQFDNDNTERLKTMDATFQSLLADMTTIGKGLDEKAKANKDNQLFVQMKHAKRRLVDMEAQTRELMERGITRYVFDYTAQLDDLIDGLPAMFELTVRDPPRAAKMKVRPLGEVNMKTGEDQTLCFVNGMAVLPGGRVVVSDRENMAVKLINMKLNVVASRMAMSSKPCDVTKIHDTQVAVSLQHEMKIELLNVSDVLSRAKVIELLHGDYFQGIHYDGSGFQVVYPIARAVKRVDMSGKIVSTVYQGDSKTPSFAMPGWIAASRDNKRLYITDEKAHTVTTMTAEGRVISTYKAMLLVRPRGVAVGGDGSVFVVDAETHHVHHLSASGELIQQMRVMHQSMASFPQAIGYGEDDDRAYISGGCSHPIPLCNNLRVFQLE